MSMGGRKLIPAWCANNLLPRAQGISAGCAKPGKNNPKQIIQQVGHAGQNEGIKIKKSGTGGKMFFISK